MQTNFAIPIMLFRFRLSIYRGITHSDNFRDCVRHHSLTLLVPLPRTEQLHRIEPRRGCVVHLTPLFSGNPKIHWDMAFLLIFLLVDASSSWSS